ncbi:hypothetical protein [Bartonella sp. PS17NMGDW]
MFEGGIKTVKVCLEVLGQKGGLGAFVLRVKGGHYFTHERASAFLLR